MYIHHIQRAPIYNSPYIIQFLQKYFSMNHTHKIIQRHWVNLSYHIMKGSIGVLIFIYIGDNLSTISVTIIVTRHQLPDKQRSNKNKGWAFSEPPAEKLTTKKTNCRSRTKQYLQ